MIEGCLAKGHLETQQCDSDPLLRREPSAVRMGMIGFDIACNTARSGSRMQGYLVNAPCKQ
jgi:hypothetical protein